ncbi:hypothetical protein JN531_012295 [Flagellatimonas centrodinii]|uniref:hypothetical protein n=1 Tax=Flagellatimonas centrodinii TaxID=2806210 RepID=UPI001FEF20F3|nr:hypothetical protein [Flagellatimonas centrodinii]ULQ45880.1 hypothetical protein JN531_012295 [Flagellatimonas centrodinii]
MAISHSNAARNAMADAVDAQVNTGSADASGDFVLIASGGPTDLVSIVLQDPAFGAAASGVITLAGTPLSNTASATGTTDTFEIRDKDNGVVIDGTVTATGGGGDVEIDNTSIASGQTVELSSLTWTAPV